MKKIFLFAAAAVAALTVNAQTYDFKELAFADADLTVTNGTKEWNESKGYFVIKTKGGETADEKLMTLTIAQLPNIEFTYSNSSVKEAYTVSPNDKITLNGDQRDLTFKNVAVGSMITLTVGSKGSTANSFEDSESKGTALTGCTWVSGDRVLPAKASGENTQYQDITVQAIASTVTIRCTAGGYNLTKIVISGNQAVDNVFDNAKAVKTFENGQLVIIKNGVKFNALGAQL